MITDELLFRFFGGETSERENRMIRDWLTNYPDQSLRVSELREIYDSAEPLLASEEIENEWNRLEPVFSADRKILKIRPSKSAKLLRIAAVLLVLVGSGLLWIFHTKNYVVNNRDLVTKTIVLPDGTQVDLGPASKLVYNDKFLEGVREIRLTGDACFNVTSDPAHPFTVFAGLAKIKVTGTRFVVNAPPTSQEVEVSVKSGNVLFYNSETLDKNSFRMSLLAGEKGIFQPSLNRMDKTKDPYFQTTP